MFSTSLSKNHDYHTYGSFDSQNTPLINDQEIPLNPSSPVNHAQNITDVEVLLDTQSLSENECTAVLLQIDETLNEASKLVKKEALPFTPEEMILYKNIVHHIENEETEITPLVNNEQAHRSRLERLTQLLSYVTNNEAKSPFGRHTFNVSNVMLRHVVTVMLPTLLRQMIAYSLEKNLNSQPYEAQKTMRTTIAFIAASYPLVLNIIGGVADQISGESNITANVGRALNLVVGLSTLCAAYATGALPSLAASLVAFNAYCLLRDSGQLLVKLDDGTNKVSVQTVAIASGAYVADQIAVGTAMAKYAAPSGQSAASLVYANVAANDAVRGAINCAGESADSLVFAYAQNAQAQQETRIKLKVGLPTIREVASTATHTHAGRTFLFTSTLLFGAALSTVTQFISDPNTREHADNVITAAFLGLFYGAFVVTATRGKVEGCTLL